MTSSWGSDDRSHREKLRALLADREWHTQAEMRAAGGDRYGSRLNELRRDELLDVECKCIANGVFQYRLRGELTEVPPRGRTWKKRALLAEERVRELEAILGWRQA